MNNTPQHILSRRQKIEHEIKEHQDEILRREKRISELRSKLSFSDLFDKKDLIPNETPYMEIRYYGPQGVCSSMIHKDEFFALVKEPVL